MPETELYEWSSYAKRRGLPTRRIEVQLAQIAWLLDRGLLGATDVAISDYILFDEVPEPTAEEVAAAFEFNPSHKLHT